MKKTIAIVALMGILLTSCVKNQSVDYNANPEPITFEVAKYLPATRADVAYPTELSFGAYAYYENVATPGHSVFMDNVKIYYHTGANPYWAAAEQYFWPIQGHLDFISYSPYNADATSPAVPTISNDNVQQTLSYTGFTVDADNPVDLMYSDKAMQQTSNTVHYGFTGVPTLFHHALAKLQFRVKAVKLNNASESSSVTNWETTVNSISINNIYNNGSVTLKTTNNHDAGATTVQWSNTITAHSYNTWMPTSSVVSKKWEIPQVLTTEARTYGAGTGTLAADYFVLPQALNESGQSITINYTIKTTAPNGQVGTANYEVTKYLKDYPVQAWEMGKNVIYTIDIDPEGDIIHFAPAVVDWEDTSGTVSI